MRKYYVGLLVVALVVSSDQASKLLARVWGLAVLNSGGVLGLFQGFYWVGLSILVLLVLIAVGLKLRNRWERLGLLTIIAAGLSNLVDRLIFGGVWDFIYYPVVEIRGNLADVWLGIGVVIILVQNLKLLPTPGLPTGKAGFRRVDKTERG